VFDDARDCVSRFDADSKQRGAESVREKSATVPAGSDLVQVPSGPVATGKCDLRTTYRPMTYRSRQREAFDPFAR